MKMKTCHSKPEEISGLLQDFPFIKTSKKIEYCNIPFSFDIETTSFYEEEEKRACMYCFVLGIDGQVIFGRTWEEVETLFQTISDKYGLDENKRIIVYVHNLAYEFQFIKDRFNWLKVFATEDRKPLTALCDLGIEFRCSYLLSGYSLELVGKNLTRYKVEKLKGDLDYSLMRHSKTAMTDKEIQYCVNDALVVMAYIQEQIEDCGNITKIPLTKTGYVRKYCRNACLYDGSHKKKTYKYLRYMDKMHRLTITSVDMYKQLKRAFQGGFTHANAFNVRQTIDDVTSFDETSAYPSVMVAELFPMSSPKKVNPKSKEEFEKYINLYNCVFDIKFYDLKAKGFVDNPLSSSKCFQKVNEIVDNGRIVEADEVTTTITEVDFKIFKEFYSWRKIIVKNMRVFKRGYLPKDFVSAILDLYEKKTTLKGVAGMEAEYMNSKEKLNSGFGMSVTDILQDNSTYDGKNWVTTSPDAEKELDKYNNSKNRFLYYAWGVWITAYARRNIFEAISNCGKDYIYSDTDSVKIRHAAEHENFFKRYNHKVIAKLKKACDYHKFSYDRIAPKTKDGVSKPLGVFDFDGHYKRFKTLGAKRYLVEYDKDLEYKNDKGEVILKCPYSLTVSGLNKKVVIPYLVELARRNKKDIFELFDNSLYIPKGYTGKKIHTYIDYPQKGEFIDYLGQKGRYNELSSVHMEEADYSLSLTRDYIDFIIGLKEEIR